MTDALARWNALFAFVNDHPTIGVAGVRDTANPCEDFTPGTPTTRGQCDTDGHYVCDECEYRATCEGCGLRPVHCECYEREIEEMKKKTKAAEEKAVERFNEAHEIGTEVRYWTGMREGDGKLSKTRTLAQMLSGHTAVVWIEDHGACIALTHIEAVA